MNEYYLDPISGEKTISRRLDHNDSSKIKSEDLLYEKITFKDVLKSVVDKTEGSTNIRQAMVDKYKNSLADGTYEVKAEELAEKMIQKIRENKSRDIV